MKRLFSLTAVLFFGLTLGLTSIFAQEKNPKTISVGVLNGKATKLVVPAYPPAATAVAASGTVNVQVIIDEKGDVV